MLVKILVKVAGINQHFPQVDIFPIRNKENGNDGTGANQYTVKIFNFCISAGDLYRRKKSLEPAFKFLFVIFIKPRVKFHIIIQQLLIVLRKWENLCAFWLESK